MKLNLLKNAKEQAQELANTLAAKIEKLLKNKNMATIAVSGGKSPIELFHQLQLAKIDWDKVIFTLVDERIVDTVHEDSNEKLIRQHLLQGSLANTKFNGLLEENCSLKDSLDKANNLVNRIDIAILGMGEDGHTASIFPDCKELGEALDLAKEPSYIITNPISAKYQRISLNLSALVRIPHLILNISNEIKLKVLKEAIKEENLNYPISYLLKNRPDMDIYWYE